MSVSDRWFVQFYHGSEDFGLLAVAAKFSLILALFATTFRHMVADCFDLMENDDGQRVFSLWVGFIWCVLLWFGCNYYVIAILGKVL